MTLATILGMYVLLATAPPGSPYVQPALVLQEAPPQQDVPQSSPAPPPPSEPQPSSQPEPTSPAPQEATPDQPAAPPSTPTQDSKQPPEASQAPATEVKPESKPSPVKKSKKRGKKIKPAAEPGDGPTKTVVRNGSTVDPEVQLSPGVSQEQASSQRKNTSQLLEKTEANLRKISVRQLDATQQDMVKQIRTYLDQAKAAAGSGDLQRARNLAFKAHLLSAELLQH
jgi:hypothetical protein